MATPFLSPSPPSPPMCPSMETSKYLYATKSHTPPAICHCGTPQETTYHHALIACAGKRCKTRYYHVHCAGLTRQHLLSNEPWLCRDCRPAQSVVDMARRVSMSASPRVCVCKEPPYIMGPMVQCAQRARCEVRWFHWVCVGFPEEGGWVCGACLGRGDGGGEEEEEDVVRGVKRGKVSWGAVEDGFLSPGEADEVTVARHDCAVHGVQLWEDAVALSVQSERSEGVAVEHRVDRREEVLEVLEDGDGLRVREGTAAESTTPESTTAPRSSTPELTMPELTTTESAAPDHTTPEPGYCFCGTPDTDNMIACDAKGCTTEWFHFMCVGLTPKTVPKGRWFCDECVEKGVKRRRGEVAGGKRKR